MDDEKIAQYVANEYAQAGHAAHEAAYMAQDYWMTMMRPSMMLKPKLYKLEFTWSASYEDVNGYGLSPEEAYLDFDRKWKEKL